MQATVPNTAAAGKSVFTGVGGCGSCHTLAAAGTTGTVGPEPRQGPQDQLRHPAVEADPRRDAREVHQTAIVKPYAYLPAGFAAGVMPNNFSQTLSKSQIQALVTFLSSATK